MDKYQFLDHPADVKLKAFGKDLPELFINAALAMTEFLFGKEIKQNGSQLSQIIVESHDLESLLVDWLAELLYLSDVHKCAFIDYQIDFFDENKIVAEVSGVKAKAQDDIKAVTYHQLEIKQTKDGWEAIVVFDV